MKLIEISQINYNVGVNLNLFKWIFISIFFIAFTIKAQDRFSTKSGDVFFEASVPNFEPVAAKNNTVSAILKDNGEFAALVLIKGFKFEKGLMQEHFNQKKYMHSKNYPKAKFVGMIDDFDLKELSEIAKEYTLTGKLTVKDVTKEIQTNAKIKILDNNIYLDTKFSVDVADFEIAVKSSAAKKIAKTVNIEVHFELKK